MGAPQPNPYVAALSPYKPGMPIEELARQYGLDPAAIIKLASNENPYGMSPQARQVIRRSAADSYRYPDGYELRKALAAHYRVAEDTIVLGNGSNDVLDLVARVFLAPGKQAVSSQHAFIVYRIVTAITGAEHVTVPAAAYGHDLAAMRQAITDTTRVVWIANPNNPTGTYIPPHELRTWLDHVPAHVMVVLDEAYYEYLNPTDRADSVSWLQMYPNLIIVRTFSKVYGLAGLRVGYALAAPQTANLLNRVRQPFNVSHIGLAAAVAALADQSFVAESYERNRQGRAQLLEGLKTMGIACLPAYGNFVTAAFIDAPSVHEALLRQGIIVRPVGEYEMPHHLRITVGTPAENRRLLAALSGLI